MDIKEKIKKLLALGTSPNENEARAAVLKAKELMIKNKLTESDFEDEKAREIVSRTCEGISWTSDSGRIWYTNICKIISENYCCVSAWSSQKGGRTYTLVITGMKNDVDICEEVIKYAIGFVLSATKYLSRKPGYSRDPKATEHSYATGFVTGLEVAFEEQKEEHPEWGLVEVKPQEVLDYEKNLGTKSVKTKRSDMNMAAYLKGQVDGSKFNTKKVLAEV